jgi:alkanesulfonate monooxygenase SsuD/methylene tetrahydromethanopterin reductase-like flavin-dependent oxidoreductase (luciferase family)
LFDGAGPPAEAASVAPVRLALMIEGQEGVTWPQWIALANTCEQAGLDGLFRSDHYTGFTGGVGGALDAWGTVTALSAVTRRIKLGTLVSPATFRHPSILARMVVTASHASGGRVELGLGAGWNEAEHRQHGFVFPPLRERMEIFAEQLEIITRSWSGETFDFHGKHYELEQAHPLPVPAGKVNVIVGGSAQPGTVGPAVRFADEYNTVFASPDEAVRRRAILDEASAAAGREPLAFSVMLRCVVGEDRAAVQRRRDVIAASFDDAMFDNPECSLEGTVDEVVARVREYEEAGVQRLMLRHLPVDDLEMVELIGREVVPRVR